MDLGEIDLGEMDLGIGLSPHPAVMVEVALR